MSDASAHSAILLSALIVAALYGYRWLVRGESSLIAGKGPEVSPEGFLMAWGVLYLMLSVASTFAAGAAGAFAVLIALSDVFANFGAVSGAISQTELHKGATQTITGKITGKKGGKHA